MTEISFVNYYQSNNHRQRYKAIETTVQSYQKMSNQNTKKSPGIKGALLNYSQGGNG